MGLGQYTLEFTGVAIGHIQFWAKSGQHALQRKIEQLLESIKEDPAKGIGKPELLKHSLTGTYSRRINREHRIVYRVKGDVITILALKGHYDQVQ